MSEVASQTVGLIAPLESYRTVLDEYLETRSEASLYRASRLSLAFVEAGVGPEDIVALHAEALSASLAGKSYREQVRAATDGLQFVLEVMIAYGVHYKRFRELQERERQLAAQVQLTLETQRARDAEHELVEKAELLRVVAHELRTPLTALGGYLQLTRRAVSQGKLADVERYVNGAAEASGRLERMTSDLLDAARGDAVPAAASAQNLRVIVVTAVDWARPAATEKELTISGPPEGGAIPIVGNADALLSVFGNLLSNAVRYTPPGGRITVDCAVHGGEAVAQICDTGIGMTPEVRARIFQQFYRAPEARNAESRGLGVGLTLAQRLVEAHHGRIAVESKPGVGSTFTVLLPLASPECAPSEDGSLSTSDVSSTLRTRGAANASGTSAS
jgi:signal transduction histidine kinase